MTVSTENKKIAPRQKETNFCIALAGNPNCGKTTLFNALTGSKQKVGNWPGVTIEKKEGILDLNGTVINLVDLPGIYGLSASSEDEKVSRDFLISGEADLVINIIDTANLERNLYLTLQIREIGIPVICVLNMMDIAEKRGFQIDTASLSAALACPVIASNALNKQAVQNLRNNLSKIIAQGVQAKAIPELQYPDKMQEFISEISKKYEAGADQPSTTNSKLHIPGAWYALRLLEKDQDIFEKLCSENPDVFKASELEQTIGDLEAKLDEESDIIVADSKYACIEQIAKKALSRPKKVQSFTEKFDRVVLNRIAGIPIFLGIMYLVFWFTISFGGAFIDFFDIAFGTIFVDGFGNLLASLGSPEWLTTFLAGGIGAGIQTVSTFIPIIFMMFLMLSIMEDSGYMARAAFVMDRLMRKIGLPGKAFVPLLLGLGCSIPAIMATRTLETKQDKISTIFMAPLMSCGARLPVYALFAAALFQTNAGFIVFSIYIVGILISIGTGLLVKNTFFSGETSHFVMELPPYHAPRIKTIFGSAWSRLKTFIIRAGKVITLVVLVLSVLNSLAITEDGISFGNEDSEASVLAQTGKFITPIFTPLGVEEENWPATVGLFTGLFAKEAVVGTVNALYSSMDYEAPVAETTDTEASAEAAESEEEFSLGAGLLEALTTIPDNLAGLVDGLLDPLGLSIITGDEESTSEELETDQSTFTLMRQFFSPAAAYAYLLFILIYFPCVAALGAAIQELGGKLGWFQAAYLTILAWAVSTLYYQIVEGHNILFLVLGAALIAGIITIFKLQGPKLAKSYRPSQNRKEAHC